MERDLTHLLGDFPFEPGRVNVRLVTARDGREVLQVRVELGVLQMECDGRPDGGASVLDEMLGGEDALGARKAPLAAVKAAALRLEAVQLQQRSVAFLALGDPSRALRDADAALAAIELVARRGESHEREWADGARFSVLVLRTRCASKGHLADGRPRDAARTVEAGLEAMRGAADRIGLADAFDSLGDVVALRALRDALVPQLPPAQRAELEARLRAAIQAENYELAAILRDELRML
ncbi:MAG: UvrB/UvrC motif-containing protein [Phycisphaerales bacterium]|jgi:hypothetical protein